MDWPKSVYIAGFAGVAVGLGGALVFTKSTQTSLPAASSAPRGNESIAQLTSALEGLTSQLTSMQECLNKLEQAMREREACRRESMVAGDGLNLPADRYDGSRFSLVSGAQSDAFDTAEEDNLVSTDEDEDALDSQVGKPKSLDSFLDDIDNLHAKKENMAATQAEVLQLLTARYDENPNQWQIMWRLARAHKNLSDLAKAENNTEERKRLIYAGVDHAKGALDANEDSWQAHQWYAIMLGLTSDFEATQTKIQNGTLFKKHVDRAIELNSSDYSLYHLLAQWCYAVAGLTWIERNAAKMLYGEPPTSSYQEALSNFMSAEDLYTGAWKNNKLMVAKCYYAQSMYSECRAWLEKAKACPIITEEDRTSEVEIDALLLRT